jgi:isopentenyl-diphosphate Delta-isomerase
MEEVILVDNKDRVLGKMEKIEAHLKGLLHRAFSVFIFNSQNQLMLQQRAFSKYHSPGLWTNTCCSHPRPGESLESAVHRRLNEEMGLDCQVQNKFHFIYKANVGEGLTEHELDNVFFGFTDAIPQINPSEVNDWKYMPVDAIRKDMKDHPELYTVWFRIVFDEVEKLLEHSR